MSLRKDSGLHAREIQGTQGGADILTNLFVGETPDPSWRLVEKGFNLSREHELESIFTVANGYVGVRGSLVEGTSLSASATFLAGVFDVNPESGSVPALVILPDWTRVQVLVDRFPVSLEEGEILDHRRILDLRQGVLLREWRQRDPAGRITQIRSLRLASLHDRRFLLQLMLITPENYTGRMDLESRLTWPFMNDQGRAAAAKDTPRQTSRHSMGGDVAFSAGPTGVGVRHDRQGGEYRSRSGKRSAHREGRAHCADDRGDRPRAH
ncbi:MAG: hypothetical protein C4293_16190 [Nitrospiraceae bacterium]